MESGFDTPKINFDANINFERDYYVGATLEHDTQKLTESAVSFVKKDDSKGNLYWLTYNATKTSVGVGCLVRYFDKNFTHAYEAKYDHSNKAPLALFAQPLVLGGGGKYVLSRDSTLTYSLEFAKETSGQVKFDHKLDKNWKVSILQSFDCDRLAAGKRAPYDLGFNVAYTL